jgi:hypothetical protein
MNRDDIIRMAREAGMHGMLTDVVTTLEELAHFAALVAAAEREACAKVAEEIDIVEFEHCMVVHQDAAKTLTNAAAAIRARGEA